MTLFCFAPQPRRALAICALFLCFLFASHFVTAVDSAVETGPTKKSETLKFLRSLVASVPDLAMRARSDDYCHWPIVSCGQGVKVTVSLVSSASTLPELPAEVDGSLVEVTEFKTDIGTVLGGTLPASWGRLTQMQKIWLSGNALEGTLPAEWSGMTSLRFLYLDKNALTGTLPAAWGAMNKMEVLMMSLNHLSGTLPSEWSGMKVLRNIHAENNALTGPLPSSWSALTYMKSVMLTNNTLSGTLPAEWSSMKPLVTIAVGNNALTGTLPAEWGSLRRVYHVDLFANHLSGSLPASWSSMRMVKSNLHLQGNNFCGCVPTEWAGVLTPTVDVAVSSKTCTTTNACGRPSSSSTATSTSTETPMTDEQRNTLKFLRAFAPMDASLAALWTGNSYCGWKYVSCPAEGSVQLDLSSLKLTTAVSLMKAAAMPKALASTASVSLPELAADVDGQQVAVTEVSVYGKGSRVAGTLPASWGRLTRLQTLRLQGNAISGTLPSAWSGMASLRNLDVSGNPLSGSVPVSWGEMSSRTSVNLKGTSLCGCLPAEWTAGMVVAESALIRSDCASVNACPVPPSSHKSESRLVPLWCVLGAVGGLLVGLALGFGLRFYCRRRREEEAKRFRSTQGTEEEPFGETPESPY
ncbi:putative GP46-like surface antigen [Leptomonas seymouri]|uniref:Putative GP46-like surface antigen n=1 Tax=Leptomonas seymouri TaxID=5684 RepID=A0A0N0P6A5_LEPSE|nr:putative GP46-like surface antigen [Leptomonas seymouri]|eukprot:KPI87399.1 putative GP46-like surface antigen [Leptomonas seymouri]